MKRLILLMATLLFSVAGFAQRLSITDICYYDTSTDCIESYSGQQLLNRLARKGFTITESVRGYDYEEECYYEVYTLYQGSTNTLITVNEIVTQIEFNSAESAIAFAAEAVELGYISWNGSRYAFTRPHRMYGIDSIFVHGKYVDVESI